MQPDDRIRRSVTNDTRLRPCDWAMVMVVAMLEQPSPLKQTSFAADGYPERGAEKEGWLVDGETTTKTYKISSNF